MEAQRTKGAIVAQIIVAEDADSGFGEARVVLRERVTLRDLNSDYFGMQLLERLGWAVADTVAVADETGAAERRAAPGPLGAPAPRS
jgi:hypothetical protein